MFVYGTCDEYFFYQHCLYVLKMSSDLLFIVLFFLTGTLFLEIVFLLIIDQRKELKYYLIMSACQVSMR